MVPQSAEGGQDPLCIHVLSPLTEDEKLFSPRHRRPQWLQMTRLYSFHCEPIIAVMLIFLFNYPAGSHGKAVIKRKSAKMNGVRVSQLLDAVTSASWAFQNTCEFWEDWSIMSGGPLLIELGPTSDSHPNNHPKLNKKIKIIIMGISKML